ncbi:MAG TPA: hypothetical protein VMR74_02260 [Gammaproteobacteria bacterium]|nr:hypothetical protein [Gammaproteobacteria bacterium]
MSSSFVRNLLVVAGFTLAAANASAQEIRCWTDENGVRRCGDSVPPDQARHDREIFNNQGIRIRSEEGEITPEEQAEIDRRRREEEDRLAAIEAQRRYDQMLLDAYLTPDQIEGLRDRRLELMDSQFRITEIILRNLYRKLEGLERDARRFSPYSDREDAPPIPQNLSTDIERTRSAIGIREQAMAEIRENQEEIRQAFQRDIDRFKQLKGLTGSVDDRP